MGYPKTYVGNYKWLADWLSKHGFKVYPMEMYCESVHERWNPYLRWERVGQYPKGYEVVDFLEDHWLYGAVDVVAWQNGKIWAFEVKHKGDKVKTALLQTANYAKYFDYSCVVAEDLKELTKHREKFKALGVGVYWAGKEGITLLDEPKLQNPEIEHRNKYYDRFLRNTGMVSRNKPKPTDTNEQKTLTELCIISSGVKP